MSPLTTHNASRLHTSFCTEVYNQAPAKMMIYIIYIHIYIHTYIYTGRDLPKGGPLSEPRIHVWINLCIRGFLTASAAGGDWVSEWWMDMQYSILNIGGGWSTLYLSGGQHKSVSNFQYKRVASMYLTLLKGSVQFMFLFFWQINGMINRLNPSGFYTYRQV